MPDFDIKQAVAKVRDDLNAARNPDVATPCLAWHTYETARVVIAGLPRRPTTIAYVLGIHAGTLFDVHDTIPGAPFKAGTAEAEDYAQGVKDALLFAHESGKRAPDFAKVFNLICGGA